MNLLHDQLLIFVELLSFNVSSPSPSPAPLKVEGPSNDKL